MLIWSTMILIGINVAIVVLVFLPPKQSPIRGVVLFLGEPPASRVIDLKGFEQPCGVTNGTPFRWNELSLSTNESRSVLRSALATVPAGRRAAGLADVLVRVVSPVPVGKTKSQPGEGEGLLMDQVHCQFVPKVLVVMTNQPLRIRTSDFAPQHVVGVSSGANTNFSFAQTTLGHTEVRRFLREDVFVRLEVLERPWMNGFVAVVENSFYAVTDADGVFELPKGLGDGPVELEVIHPKLGKKRVSIDPKTSGQRVTILLGME
jgi:hypothetical protein